MSARRPTLRTCLALCLLAATCSWLAPPAAGAAQRLETWTLTSRFVNPAINPFNGQHVLRVNVLLPNGYDGKRRFPLLVLLHGHGDSYSSWMNPKKGDLLGIAPGLQAIVVMPEGGEGWYTDWWSDGARGLDGHGWESFYLDELLPTIQRRLRILPQRRYHAIAGLSMGGEGATYLASQRPDYFGTVASFSGVLSLLRPEWPTGFNTQGQDFQTVYGAPGGFYVQGHDPATLAANFKDSRVFVRVGDGLVIPPYPNELNNTFGIAAEAELRQHAQDFVAAAQAAGVATHYEPVHGIHDWPWWRMALASALQWGLFGDVPDAPTSWTYRTVRTSGRAWELRYRFASPPTALETFQRNGSTLSGTGSGTVTITPDSGRPFTVALPFTRVLVLGPVISRVRTARHGRALRFSLTQPARVKIRIARRRCTPSRGGRRCHLARYGVVVAHAHAGVNLLRLGGWIHRRRLPAGHYVLTVSASNANGVSRPVRATFRLL